MQLKDFAIRNNLVRKASLFKYDVGSSFINCLSLKTVTESRPSTKKIPIFCFIPLKSV